MLNIYMYTDTKIDWGNRTVSLLFKKSLAAGYVRFDHTLGACYLVRHIGTNFQSEHTY